MNSQEVEPLSTMVHTVFGAGGTWYFVVSRIFPPSSFTDSCWPIGLGTSSGFMREDEELFPVLRSEREPRGDEFLWLALVGDDALGVPPGRKLLSECRFWGDTGEPQPMEKPALLLCLAGDGGGGYPAGGGGAKPLPTALTASAGGPAYCGKLPV